MNDSTRQEVVPYLCEAYGIGQPSAVEPAGGTAGTNLEITTATGRFFLRRRSAEHTDVAQVCYDHELLAFLAENNMPVSPPLADRDSSTFVRHGQHIFELFQWVEGRQFASGNAEQIIDLGRTLARIHLVSADRAIRKDKPWEQDPKLLSGDLDVFAGSDAGRGAKSLVKRIRDELGRLMVSLAEDRCRLLPRAIIHGDLHPGNAKFDTTRLVGVFDWDWANYRMRITDICDAISFFAHGPQAPPIDWDDIWQMTSGLEIDGSMARALLQAYRSVAAITPLEREMLNDFLAARWLQERIRGMRKVPIEHRLEFLDRGDLFEVLGKLKTFAV